MTEHLWVLLAQTCQIRRDLEKRMRPRLSATLSHQIDEVIVLQEHLAEEILDHLGARDSEVAA